MVAYRTEVLESPVQRRIQQFETEINFATVAVNGGAMRITPSDAPVRTMLALSPRCRALSVTASESEKRSFAAAPEAVESNPLDKNSCLSAGNM
jgi:hypothetical protein